ncbi:MAG: Ca-activated chloride channel [Acidimicrobiaceae bacterium]
MSFLDPEKMFLLAGVVALAAIYVVLQQRRRQYAVRFTNLALLDKVAPKRPGWRRHAAALGFLLAIASLVVAFARPTHDGKVPRERATIIMAIDVSLSMEATDDDPSRIEAAKTAAKAFLQTIPEKVNVGLVSFAGNTHLDVSPTTDRQRVSIAIDSLKLGESTAIGEAIFTSLDAIDQFGKQTSVNDPNAAPVPASIVLMSDGDTQTGRPNDQAAAAAKQAGVPVTTIAFGTDHGEVTVPDSPVPVLVAVNHQALQRIADQTGGQYYAAATEAQLASVYEHIGSSVGYETKQLEITEWFIGIGLLALLATAAMSLAWFSRLP